MTRYSLSKFYIFPLLVLSFVISGVLLSVPQHVSAADCEITAADWYLNKNVLPLIIRNSSAPGLELNFKTSNCAGWSARMEIIEVDGTFNPNDVVKVVTTPTGTTNEPKEFRLPFIAGEFQCDINEITDCEIKATITPYKDSPATTGDSFAVPYNLKYQCKSPNSCDANAVWSVGDYATLGNLADKTPVNKTVTTLGGCTVTSAEFEPYSKEFGQGYTEYLPRGYSNTFFKDSTPPLITITIKTSQCANRDVYVTLYSDRIPSALNPFSAAMSLFNAERTVPELRNKKFIVPESESFTIKMKAGETSCFQTANITDGILGFGGDDCRYYLYAGPSSISDNEANYFSQNKPYGALRYECDTACDEDWKYVSDTSKNPTENSTVLVTEGNTGNPSEECVDASGEVIQGCYQLFSDFSDTLGKGADGLVNKFTVINVNSLGGFINSLIALATGIAGVITVGMIFYEGFLYMKSKEDGNPEKLAGVKSRIFKTVLGFLLLLSIYVILRTINPDLLNLTPRIDEIGFDIKDRAADPKAADYVENIDVSNITTSASDFSDSTFLAYLSHQQGAAGAASILWAAQQGYSSVPNKTPFISKDGAVVNRNMRNNVFKDFKSITGSNSVTPAAFLTYWQKKVARSELSSTTIPNNIDTALKTVSDEINIPISTLRAICRIESYGCTNPNAVNGSYSGLFQLGKEEFAKYKKAGSGSIWDPYANSYAGANYARYNLGQMNKYWPKIIG